MEQENLPPFVMQAPGPSPIDKRVGFGRRLGAKLLDAFVVIIIAIVAYYAVGNEVHDALDRMARITYAKQGIDVTVMNDDSADWVLANFKLTVFMTFASFLLGLTELFFGASPGKMLLAMQIAHADGTRGSIALWARRWALINLSSMMFFVSVFTEVSFFSTLSSLLSFVVGLGCLMALSQQRQALHDVLAKTAVYRDNDIH